MASGQTYERAPIKQWLRTNSTDPSTGVSIGEIRFSSGRLGPPNRMFADLRAALLPGRRKQLAPNVALRSMILDWKGQHGIG